MTPFSIVRIRKRGRVWTRGEAVSELPEPSTRRGLSATRARGTKQLGLNAKQPRGLGVLLVVTNNEIEDRVCPILRWRASRDHDAILIYTVSAGGWTAFTWSRWSFVLVLVGGFLHAAEANTGNRRQVIACTTPVWSTACSQLMHMLTILTIGLILRGQL